MNVLSIVEASEITKVHDLRLKIYGLLAVTYFLHHKDFTQTV